MEHEKENGKENEKRNEKKQEEKHTHQNRLAAAVNSCNFPRASWYSRSTTSACLSDRGSIEHSNGSGLELNPSEKAKLLPRSSASPPAADNASKTHMSTSIFSPFSFRPGPTLNAHKIRAMLMATDAEPRCIPGQIRRPQPKALWPKFPGYSRCSRKRSGRNSWGSGKSSSLRWTGWDTSVRSESRRRTRTVVDLLLHKGAMTVLPFGMNMPLYTSSAVVACGVPPRTATGRQRRVSATMARMYSRDAKSSNVGSLSLPTTLSNSACALGMKVSPNLAQASRKLASEPADLGES